MANLERIKKAALLAGKTMNLNLRHCQIDLAVSVSDLLYKLENNDTVIIESFRDEEYEELKIIIRGALEDGKKVLFYVPNNEERITGMADELGMPIYMYDDEIEALL